MRPSGSIAAAAVLLLGVMGCSSDATKPGAGTAGATADATGNAHEGGGRGGMEAREATGGSASTPAVGTFDSSASNAGAPIAGAAASVGRGQAAGGADSGGAPAEGADASGAGSASVGSTGGVTGGSGSVGGAAIGGGAATDGGLVSNASGGREAGSEGGPSGGVNGAGAPGLGNAGESSAGGVPEETFLECTGVPVEERAAALGAEDAACTGVSIEPKGLPTSLLVMFDRSVGLAEAVPGYETRWAAYRSGVEAFLSHYSTRTEIGVGFFSIDGSESEETNCRALDYAEPVVAMGTPEIVGTEILETFEAVAPAGPASTVPALEGAIRYAASYAVSHPEREVSVVLVAIGPPTLCSGDDGVAELASVAALGFQGEPHVRTTVVSSEGGAILDDVARAGGTTAAWLLEADRGDVGAAFGDALLFLSGGDQACRLEVPQPDTGSMATLDPERILIYWTSPLGTEEEIPRVSSAASCESSSWGGWYYPDPENSPNRIELCPCTCARRGQETLIVAAGCAPIRILD